MKRIKKLKYLLFIFLFLSCETFQTTTKEIKEYQNITEIEKDSGLKLSLIIEELDKYYIEKQYFFEVKEESLTDKAPDNFIQRRGPSEFIKDSGESYGEYRRKGMYPMDGASKGVEIKYTPKVITGISFFRNGTSKSSHGLNGSYKNSVSYKFSFTCTKVGDYIITIPVDEEKDEFLKYKINVSK